MTTASLPRPFRGIVPPLITPLLDRDTLNREGLERLIERVIKGMKCALSLLGVCDDFMAEPFHRFREPERERVRQVLVELGLLR
jgi:dihydrodipicolinate synthase/N-acetylneuraminate lyase